MDKECVGSCNDTYIPLFIQLKYTKQYLDGRHSGDVFEGVLNFCCSNNHV